MPCCCSRRPWRQRPGAGRKSTRWRAENAATCGSGRAPGEGYNGCWATAQALSLLAAPQPLEPDDRDPPRCLLAVLVEARHLAGVVGVEPLVVLVVLDDAGFGLELFTQHLDGHDRVRDEVVV